MPEPSTLAVFSVAAFALILIPGPAVLFVVSRSVQQGRTAGLLCAFGIELGAFVHVIAAAVGLSALLASSATAFTIVKWAGAGYLVVLGVRRLLDTASGVAGNGTPPAPRSPRRLVAEGVLVNALNPKVALFFLAFLPQFVDPDRGAVPLQILVLGTIFAFIGLLCDSGWALLAGTAGGVLRRSRRAATVERWASGTVMVGLGVAAATAGDGRRR